MDKRLQLIAHLYDEDLEGLEPLDTLIEDPELREEYRMLRESRFALDHRKRARPGVDTIEAIVRAAVSEPGMDVRPTDRPPLRLVRTKRFLVPAVSIAAMILIAIAVYPLLSSRNVSPAPQLAEKAEPAAAVAESLLQALPPPPAADLAAAEAKETTESAGSLPAWDTSRDLRQLSRRIAALRAAGVDSWGSPAVPLEMLPTDDPGPTDLVPAASGRQGH